jgi:hypothetical protein
MFFYTQQFDVSRHTKSTFDRLSNTPNFREIPTPDHEAFWAYLDS